MVDFFDESAFGYAPGIFGLAEPQEAPAVPEIDTGRTPTITNYGRYGRSSTVGQRTASGGVTQPANSPQYITPGRNARVAGKADGGSRGGGVGGGGTRYKPATGFTQTTTRTPTKALPTLGAAPQFALPARDDARRRRLTQEAASPGLRSLRRQTRLALMRQHYDDPRARENIRAALAGHGDALSQVMGEAGQRGRAEYRAERAEEIGAAQLNYQASIARWQGQFQAAMQDYLATFESTTSKKSRFGSAGIDSGGAPRTRTTIFGGHGPVLGKTSQISTIWPGR